VQSLVGPVLASLLRRWVAGWCCIRTMRGPRTADRWAARDTWMLWLYRGCLFCCCHLRLEPESGMNTFPLQSFLLRPRLGFWQRAMLADPGIRKCGSKRPGWDCWPPEAAVLARFCWPNLLSRFSLYWHVAWRGLTGVGMPGQPDPSRRAAARLVLTCRNESGLVEEAFSSGAKVEAGPASFMLGRTCLSLTSFTPAGHERGWAGVAAQNPRLVGEGQTVAVVLALLSTTSAELE